LAQATELLASTPLPCVDPTNDPPSLGRKIAMASPVVTISSAPSIIGDFADGVQEEMMATMLSFYKGAAAACAEVCIARLRLLYAQLQRSFEDDRRQYMASSPLGSSFNSMGGLMSSNALHSGESRHSTLLRSIRRRLEAQGETPADFFRARALAGQGLISREDFIASLSSLGLGATVPELMDLFAHAIGSVERDTAVVDELVMALEMPGMQGAMHGASNGAMALPFPEVERVISRVRNAVGRSGRPFEEIYRGFCRSGGGAQGLMSRTDLARVLSTFEPGLEPDIVTRLWRMVVPDHSAGLDFNAFCTWFCPGGRPLTSMPQMGGYQQQSPSLESSFGGTAMLQQLLDMSSMSPKNSGRRSPAMSPHSTMHTLTGQHTPQVFNNASTLYPEHMMSQDWQQQTNMSMLDQMRQPSRERFTSSFELPRDHIPAQLHRDELPLLACLHRLNKGLAAKGLNFSSAFVLYDKNMERAVMLEGMVAACEHHGVPLSQQEIGSLFARLARSSPMGRPPRIFFEDLEAALQRIPEPLPEAQWARDLIMAVDKITRAAGTPLESVFKQLGRDSVSAADVQSVLSRHAPLSDAQWAALLPLIDKRLDGTIPWQSLLKWAGVEVQSAPAPAVAVAKPALAVAPLASTAPSAARPAALAPAGQIAPVPTAPVAGPAVAAVGMKPNPLATPAAPTPLAPPNPVAAAAPLASAVPTAPVAAHGASPTVPPAPGALAPTAPLASTPPPAPLASPLASPAAPATAPVAPLAPAVPTAHAATASAVPAPPLATAAAVASPLAPPAASASAVAPSAPGLPGAIKPALPGSSSLRPLGSTQPSPALGGVAPAPLPGQTRPGITPLGTQPSPLLGSALMPLPPPGTQVGGWDRARSDNDARQRESRDALGRTRSPGRGAGTHPSAASSSVAPPLPPGTPPLPGAAPLAPGHPPAPLPPLPGQQQQQQAPLPPLPGSASSRVGAIAAPVGSVPGVAPTPPSPLLGARPALGSAVAPASGSATPPLPGAPPIPTATATPAPLGHQPPAAPVATATPLPPQPPLPGAAPLPTAAATPVAAAAAAPIGQPPPLLTGASTPPPAPLAPLPTAKATTVAAPVLPTSPGQPPLPSAVATPLQPPLPPAPAAAVATPLQPPLPVAAAVPVGPSPPLPVATAVPAAVATPLGGQPIAGAPLAPLPRPFGT